MSKVEKVLARYSDELKTPGKTESQVKRELEKELNALLDDWKKTQDEKEKKPKESGDEKNDKHSLSSGQLKAVLWRDGSYNRKCYRYLEKNASRREVFEMTRAGRRARLQRAFNSATVIEYFLENYGFSQRNENFNSGSTMKSEANTILRKGSKKRYSKKRGKTSGNAFPYKWNGHHMIPCGAFYQGQKKKGAGKGMITSIFTDDQYALLLMSEFNVNHGQNVIPLPCRARFFQPVHDMILHPSDHDKYTKDVQRQMKEISHELDQLAGDADKPHPDVSVDIAQELADFEDKLWKDFVDWGQSEVDARLAGEKAELPGFIKNGALV